MARLIVVSNRVPLPVGAGAACWRLGGCSRGCRPAGLAVVWLERPACRPTRDGPRLQRADGVTYATIDLSEAEYRSFYVNYSNGALWPLLHFRLGLVQFRREDYEGYREVNRRFAEALAPLVRDDDVIWVHDYHLFPLAEELRALGVENRIGFFLHTPFVPPALMQALPRAVELLRAICNFDVVGFHTQVYRQAFLDCVHEMLGAARTGHGNFFHAQTACASRRRSNRHRCGGICGNGAACRAQRRGSASAGKPRRTGAGHWC